MAVMLDGKAVAMRMKDDITSRVDRLKEKGVTVGLGTILVGDDPGSVKYVNGKHRDCSEVGIESIRVDLPSDASETDIIDAIRYLNANPDCTGYIVQLPLPPHINASHVIDCISPVKDADGLHPYNLGELVLHTDGDASTPVPCTPAGIIRLLDEHSISLDGKNVCVIGRGVTVGRTIGLMLSARNINATVDLCHTGTRNLEEHVQRADIVVACAGKAGMVTPDMLGGDVVLVDVGVSRVVDARTGKHRVSGDIDHACYDDPRVRAFTPNPGGVGPMTRVMLLENVVSIAESVVTS